MTKKIFYILYFTFYISLSCDAQLFLPIDDDPFGVPIHFDVDSIHHNKIKSITANLQYKPDEHIIDDKGLKEFYQFDSVGRLNYYWRNKVKSYQTDVIDHRAIFRHGRQIKAASTEFLNHYVYDTIFVNYYYDYKNRLACRRECDGDFYYTWYYIYNEDGTVARKTHCRETNNGQTHFNFRLGVQTIISQEDFSYQKFSPTQVKQLCLNDEGKPYKETMMLFDKKGRPIDSREEYTAGGIRIVTTWQYDSLGRTKGLTYNSNAGDALADRTEFNYDSLGRTASVKRFHNEVLTDEFSYLYDGNAMVPYAYINRRYVDLGIDIVKLDVVYWN